MHTHFFEQSYLLQTEWVRVKMLKEFLGCRARVVKLSSTAPRFVWFPTERWECHHKRVNITTTPQVVAHSDKTSSNWILSSLKTFQHHFIIFSTNFSISWFCIYMCWMRGGGIKHLNKTVERTASYTIQLKLRRICMYL